MGGQWLTSGGKISLLRKTEGAHGLQGTGGSIKVAHPNLFRGFWFPLDPRFLGIPPTWPLRLHWNPRGEEPYTPHGVWAPFDGEVRRPIGVRGRFCGKKGVSSLPKKSALFYILWFCDPGWHQNRRDHL